MRRLGLLISSVLASGMILAASVAFANQPRQGLHPEVRPIEHRLQGQKHPLLRPLFVPAKAAAQGKLDDQLIRPRRAYDASAGLLG